MKPQNPELSARRTADPTGFWLTLRQALEVERSVPKAARRLGIGSATLERWLRRDPALKVGVDLPKPRGITARPELASRPKAARHKAPRPVASQPVQNIIAPEPVAPTVMLDVSPVVKLAPFVSGMRVWPRDAKAIRVLLSDCGSLIDDGKELVDLCPDLEGCVLTLRRVAPGDNSDGDLCTVWIKDPDGRTWTSVLTATAATLGKYLKQTE